MLLARRERVQDELGASDREGRVDHHPGGERLGRVERGFALARQLIDETHLQGRPAVEALGGEQDPLGVGESDQGQQRAALVGVVDDAEPRGRNAEVGARLGDPEVARLGEPEAAADAIAGDRRDGRLGDVPDGLAAGDHRLFVAGAVLGTAAHLVELRNVGARAEIAAGASEDHHTGLAILLQGTEDCREPPPHVEGHAIAALGPVQGHDDDPGIVAIDQNHVFDHGMAFPFSRGPSLRPTPDRQCNVQSEHKVTGDE